MHGWRPWANTWRIWWRIWFTFVFIFRIWVAFVNLIEILMFCLKAENINIWSQNKIKNVITKYSKWICINAVGMSLSTGKRGGGVLCFQHYIRQRNQETCPNREAPRPRAWKNKSIQLSRKTYSRMAEAKRAFAASRGLVLINNFKSIQSAYSTHKKNGWKILHCWLLFCCAWKSPERLWLGWSVFLAFRLLKRFALDTNVGKTKLTK